MADPTEEALNESTKATSDVAPIPKETQDIQNTVPQAAPDELLPPVQAQPRKKYGKPVNTTVKFEEAEMIRKLDILQRKRPTAQTAHDALVMYLNDPNTIAEIESIENEPKPDVAIAEQNVDEPKQEQFADDPPQNQ